MVLRIMQRHTSQSFFRGVAFCLENRSDCLVAVKWPEGDTVALSTVRVEIMCAPPALAATCSAAPLGSHLATKTRTIFQ